MLAPSRRVSCERHAVVIAAVRSRHMMIQPLIRAASRRSAAWCATIAVAMGEVGEAPESSQRRTMLGSTTSSGHTGISRHAPSRGDPAGAHGFQIACGLATRCGLRHRRNARMDWKSSSRDPGHRGRSQRGSPRARQAPEHVPVLQASAAQLLRRLHLRPCALLRRPPASTRGNRRRTRGAPGTARVLRPGGFLVVRAAAVRWGDLRGVVSETAITAMGLLSWRKRSRRPASRGCREAR